MARSELAARVIRRPFSLALALLVLAVAIAGCTAVLSFGATHQATVDDGWRELEAVDSV